MAALCEVGGYRVMAVHCPALHYLYVREHDPRQADPELPSGRTLFIANLPSEFTEVCKMLRQ